MPKRKATVRAGWRPDAPVLVASARESPRSKPAPPRVRTRFPSEQTPSGSESTETEEDDKHSVLTDLYTPSALVVEVAAGPSKKPAAGDAVAVNDRRSRWAPGQWDAWKAHLAKEEAANASLSRAQRKLVQQIVDEFNDAHAGRGWSRKTVHSIRAQRSRVGEANPTYRDSRLSQQERKRALELFQQNGRSWATAVELFNEETGRNLTRGALMQSTRRMSPTSLPQELLAFSDAAIAASTFKRSWTKAEVEALLPLTQTKAEDLHAAYISFLETMKAQNPEYVPRTYQGFLTELSLVRRARM